MVNSSCSPTASTFPWLVGKSSVTSTLSPDLVQRSPLSKLRVPVHTGDVAAGLSIYEGGESLITSESISWIGVRILKV